MMDPTAEILNPECSLCDHKLDHYALMVCEHPTLPVLLCLLCLEDISEKLQDNEKESRTGEQCSWCGMCEHEGGTLYICGDGETCSHSFCSDCLERNLGSQFISSLDESDEDWKCLVCDLKQVSNLTDALTSCRANSMYTALNNTPISNPQDECKLETPQEENHLLNKDVNTSNEAEAEIEKNLSRLSIVLRQIDIANRSLEDDTISSKEKDIRTELFGSGSTDLGYVPLHSNFSKQSLLLVLSCRRSSHEFLFFLN